MKETLICVIKNHGDIFFRAEWLTAVGWKAFVILVLCTLHTIQIGMLKLAILKQQVEGLEAIDHFMFKWEQNFAAIKIRLEAI